MPTLPQPHHTPHHPNPATHLHPAHPTPPHDSPQTPITTPFQEILPKDLHLSDKATILSYMAKEATMNTIKQELLEQANKIEDRSDWEVCFAKEDITHRGRVVLTKGEPALFDPQSFNRNNFTIYLVKNLGGCNTTLKRFHFNFTK